MEIIQTFSNKDAFKIDKRKTFFYLDLKGENDKVGKKQTHSTMLGSSSTILVEKNSPSTADRKVTLTILAWTLNHKR